MTKIRISCNETGKGLVLICEDDGVGITREDKEPPVRAGLRETYGPWPLPLPRDPLDYRHHHRENGEPGKGARFEMNVPEGVYRFGQS